MQFKSRVKREIAIWINVSKYKNLKEHCACEKNYISNPATCSCKNGRYVEIIIGNSLLIDKLSFIIDRLLLTVIRCDEITGTTKTVTIKITSTKAFLTKCSAASLY